MRRDWCVWTGRWIRRSKNESVWGRNEINEKELSFELCTYASDRSAWASSERRTNVQSESFSVMEEEEGKDQSADLFTFGLQTA